MKSKQDFSNQAEWFEYLKYYYAGIALGAILSNTGLVNQHNTDFDDQKSMWKIASIAIDNADALIKKLKNTKT